MKSISPIHVGSNAERTKLHNRQVVLQCLRTLQTAGRAQIARASKLSTQTVSNIISELQSEGWLLEAGRVSKGRGLPAIQYSIRPTAATALGMEIRSDAVFAAVVDLAGNTLASDRTPVTDSRPERVAAAVSQMKSSVIDKAKIPASSLLGAGIVMPGPFGRVGLSDAGQSTLVGWHDVDPQALFSRALNIPVVIEHDTIAAVFAERVSGHAIDLDSYAFIYFGTGIGLGVMANGQVLRGAFGNAGELGHVVIERGGNPCACGNSGCLETYVSRFSLHKHLAKNNIYVSDGNELEALYDAGNPHLNDWLDHASAPLAQVIGMVENLFDPQSIILGGAMPAPLLDYLISQITLAPGSIADRSDRLTPRVVRGKSGRMTAALGGAAIIINELFVPRIAAA